MRLLAALLLAACTRSTSPESPAPEPVPDGPREPGNRALLVGPEAATGPLAALLTDTYGTDHVEVVEPTSADGVLAELDSLARATAQGSAVVVYFGLPGARVRDVNLDEPDPWDEALVVSGEWLLDDALAPRLAAIEQVAGSLTVIFDVELPASGEAAAALAEPDHVGDGLAEWPRPPSAIQIGLGARGVPTGQSGHLATALVTHAPLSATVGVLEQRLVSDAALVERTLMARVEGAADAPVFGVAREVDVPEVTSFELDPMVLEVHVDLPAARLQELSAAVERDIRYQGWLSFTRTARAGQFSVQADPMSPSGGVLILGPEGAMRNRFVPEGGASIDGLLLERLWLHARQHAFRSLGLPPDPELTVRLVEAPQQSSCSRGRWKQAAPGEEQIVPVCHRWQIEASLSADAPADREVGGVILGNDGTMVGFPLKGAAVRLAPGATHRFELPVRGSVKPKGIRSLPPLGIPEHVMAFSGPAGSQVSFHNVSTVGQGVRSRAGTTGAWRQVSLVYRVEANPEDDPLQPVRTRELTLDGYDVRPLLPANTNSYLYRLLENAERLAHMKNNDGLDYAQCLPKASSGINDRSRFSEERWPGGTCWGQAWDFARDDAQLRESPGIDCSTTVWWMFTRACLGDARAPVPARRSGESATSYHRRVVKFHTEERRCLLLSDESYRAGYLNTASMLNEALMSKHWDRCDIDALRTGDVLVTKTESGGGGHTYVVIDPDRYVVFGSHIADLDFDRLDDEFKELWKEYEREAGDRDTGVEYQFLTFRRDKEGGRFSGFNSEVVKACWRHKTLSAEWQREPTSRPGTGVIEGICRDDACPPG